MLMRRLPKRQDAEPTRILVFDGSGGRVVDGWGIDVVVMEPDTPVVATMAVVISLVVYVLVLLRSTGGKFAHILCAATYK